MTAQLVRVRLMKQRAMGEGEFYEVGRESAVAVLDVSQVLFAYAADSAMESTVLHLATGVEILIDEPLDRFHQMWDRFLGAVGLGMN